MHATIQFARGSQVIYNPDLITEVPEWLFDPARIASGASTRNQGRGSVHLFPHAGMDLVLREYRRGGLVRHFVKETYLYTSLEHTRMWREFILLEDLCKLDLPVPTPVASCCRRTSPLTYKGALISLEIPEASTLAEVLVKESLGNAMWESVGRVIARFHNHDVNHSDLNANNILLTPELDIHVIDFDKSLIQPTMKPSWTRSNLDRLLRSLHKLQRASSTFHFRQKDWDAFLQGYSDSTMVDQELVAETLKR